MRNLLIGLLVYCTLVQGMTGQRLGALRLMRRAHVSAHALSRTLFIAVPVLVRSTCRLGGRSHHPSKRLLCFAGGFKPVPSFKNDAEVQAAADFAVNEVNPMPRHCSTPGRGTAREPSDRADIALRLPCAVPKGVPSRVLAGRWFDLTRCCTSEADAGLLRRSAVCV